MTRRGRSFFVAAFLLVVGGCATATESEVGGDAGSGGGRDARAGDGGGGGSSDGGDEGGGGSCVLGSPDHCGRCDVACPGVDDATTARTCSDATAAGQCDLLCRGESYDMDGDPKNGCEATEPSVHDASSPTAITLPDANDATYKTNPLNVVDYVFDDLRTHESPPAQRPLGREDWWKVTAVGTGVSNATMSACLGITNFPSDDRFEVCISDPNQTTFATASCATVSGGGTSTCVKPPGGGDAGGPYYVRVRKTGGSNSVLGYALFLEH